MLWAEVRELEAWRLGGASVSAAAESELVACRRHLHANPELSFEEEGTARAIEARLRAAGIEDVRRVSGTGVVALIEGAQPGPTLAFRADTDALPIQEEGEVEYRSKVPGVMHACGHDVHTTVGLGVALALHANRDGMCGRVKMIFQPAEEAPPSPDGPVGAARMVADGVLRGPDVDAMFALHCMPDLDAGKIGYTGGPVWARSELMEITIQGSKAHAAYPHEGVDAALAAAHVLVALQTIASRRVDTRRPCVVTVGRLEAGVSYNILAEDAKLTGIIRTLSDEVSEQVKAEVVRIVEGVCGALGARGSVRFVPGARLTANAVWLERWTVQAISEAVGASRVVAHLPQLGAEDFAAFSREVPGCYLFLGIRDEARGIAHALHTPRFDVDESCMGLGVSAMAQAMLRLGREWSAVASGVNGG
jgi:amidohydrolase